jgi:hypothetical protein
MASNLIIPRCSVYWGEDNLNLYQLPGIDEPQPLVYDVQVNLEDTGNAPTASMKWNPSGPAMAVYEKFIIDPKKMEEQISIRFFYANGKSINFKFVWSGQSINYGTDMSIEVKMRSELDGIINANLRSYAQAYEKPAEVISSISRLEKQFGVENLKLIKYTKQANDDLKKAKVENAYASDVVFTSALTNMIKANGNIPFASNIDQAGVVIYTPYTWEKNPEIINAVNVPPQQSPDPTKRYGYILGPSLIETITRSTEWQPPQQSNVNNPLKATIPQSKNQKELKTSTQSPQSKPQSNTQQAAKKKTSSPSGTSNGKSHPTMRLTNNEDGPKKQELLNTEKQAKLSASMLMTPVITGIKPHDIIYIPSFTGNYIEDWIVNSVTYEQADGLIRVSVQATRSYGLGNPMQKKPAEEFLAFAKERKLIGENASLEAWQEYAWPATLKG